MDRGLLTLSGWPTILEQFGNKMRRLLGFRQRHINVPMVAQHVIVRYVRIPKLLALVAISAHLAASQTVNAVKPGLAHVVGRVLDQSGRGVPNIKVQALASYVDKGEPIYKPVGGALSDQDGSYLADLLDLVFPAKVYLVAVPSLSVESVQRRFKSHTTLWPVRTYYPSALSRKEGTPLTIDSGMIQTGLNIRIRYSALFSVSGRIAGPLPENQGKKRYVELDMSDPAEYVEIARTDVELDGAFLFSPVPPGTYELWLGSYGQWPDLRPCKPEIVVQHANISGLAARVDTSSRR